MFFDRFEVLLFFTSPLGRGRAGFSPLRVRGNEASVRLWVLRLINIYPLTLVLSPRRGNRIVFVGRFAFIPDKMPEFFEYAVQIFVNIAVPKSDDAVAVAFEHSCPRLIVFFVFCVLVTVEFNNQFFLFTDKVRYVFIDRDLAAEFKA